MVDKSVSVSSPSGFSNNLHITAIAFKISCVSIPHGNVEIEKIRGTDLLETQEIKFQVYQEQQWIHRWRHLTEDLDLVLEYDLVNCCHCMIESNNQHQNHLKNVCFDNTILTDGLTQQDASFLLLAVALVSSAE